MSKVDEMIDAVLGPKTAAFQRIEDIKGPEREVVESRVTDLLGEEAVKFLAGARIQIECYYGPEQEEYRLDCVGRKVSITPAAITTGRGETKGVRIKFSIDQPTTLRPFSDQRLENGVPLRSDSLTFWWRLGEFIDRVDNDIIIYSPDEATGKTYRQHLRQHGPKNHTIVIEGLG